MSGTTAHQISNRYIISFLTHGLAAILTSERGTVNWSLDGWLDRHWMEEKRPHRHLQDEIACRLKSSAIVISGKSLLITSRTLIHWLCYTTLIHCLCCTTLIHWLCYTTLIHCLCCTTLIHCLCYTTLIHCLCYTALIHCLCYTTLIHCLCYTTLIHCLCYTTLIHCLCYTTLIHCVCYTSLFRLIRAKYKSSNYK